MIISELLQYLHLEKSKSVKEFTAKNLSSDGLRTGEVERGGKSFVKIRLRVLRWCTLLISAISRDEESPETHKDFFKEGI